MRAEAPALATAALALVLLVAWVGLDGPREPELEQGSPDRPPDGLAACSADDVNVEVDAFRLAGHVVRANRWCGVDQVVAEVSGDRDGDDHVVVVLASSVASITLTTPFGEPATLALGTDGWLAVGIVQASAGALARGGVWLRVTGGAPRP